MDTIIRYLTEVSQRLGAGTDPAIILGGGVAAFLFLVMILFALRTSANRNVEAQRTSTVVNRLENLEGNMQKFRKEIEEMSSVYRDQTSDLRDELTRLRRMVEGGGSGDGGGGSGPSGRGGGGGPFGSDPGRRSSSRDDFSSSETSLPQVSQATPATLTSGLTKTRRGFLDRIKGLFGGKDKLDTGALDSIEELLIGADLGVTCVSRVMEKLREKAAVSGSLSFAQMTEASQEALVPMFTAAQPTCPMYQPARMDGTPYIVMVVGVNGAGKTTTVAKLAHRWKSTGQRVMVVAADTFRAGAVDQLQVWADRIGVEFVSGDPQAKPATVAYMGMEAAKEKGVDVVLIDTAGRLHTKSNLMQELEGVRNSIRKHYPDAPHETVLVVDGVSGQNALLQAREFNSAVSLSGVVVTKLDGTAKGGIVAAISNELRLPVFYVGVGEGMNDLIPFDVPEFVSGLFQEKRVATAKSVFTSSLLY